ncbi:unnamed protein product, partial [Porites lobata]
IRRRGSNLKDIGLLAAKARSNQIILRTEEMCSYIRAFFVLVSLFFFLQASEAGLLQERLLSRPMLRDVYSKKSTDVENPSYRSMIIQQQDKKLRLSSFHTNGHTLGFHSQTQKLKPPYTVSVPQESTQLSRFHLNGHTWDFIHRLKCEKHLVHYNKQYHRKVLLSGFLLNGQAD